jgi:hypothetical protein
MYPAVGRHHYGNLDETGTEHMKILTVALILAAGAVPALQILAGEAATPWRILIANDTCEWRIPKSFRL